MNDIFSFYRLISNYQIEIPVIQRDYAQGRNNTKAADVRKNIVSKIIDAVSGNEKLSFDFVYGRFEDTKFFPFDGQQRLTTLFLFHKYVYEKCEQEGACGAKCLCKSTLAKFTYATRQSSKEFCQKIVEKKIIPVEKDSKVSQNVMNQPWFYSEWENDPTIMGMLSMLDEIHCQFNAKTEVDYHAMAEKLNSGCSCPISFHLVNMGEQRLSDDTYIKMNARGKSLTAFENFKASLLQYLENKKDDEDARTRTLKKRFEGKYDKGKYTGIDGVWTDMFWEAKQQLPDSLMMSFMNRHFTNVWRNWYAQQSEEQQKELADFDQRVTGELWMYPSTDDFVAWEIYEGIFKRCKLEICLKPLFNCWDALCKNRVIIEHNCQAVWNRNKVQEDKDFWDLFQGNRNRNNRETYPSRIVFYALLLYFKNDDNCESLGKWMRIVWNIVENSTIDSRETYCSALSLITKLSIASRDIYKGLAYYDYDFELGEKYHAKEQVEEEKVKSILFLEEKRQDGKSWEDVVIEAESTAFFKGAIRFLFRDEDGEVNWVYFDKKWGNAKEYFDENGVKEEYKIPLTKTLVMQCSDWDNQLYDKKIFNPNANTWKWILCAENWRSAIHSILSANDLSSIIPMINNMHPVMKVLPYLPYDNMIKREPTGRFRWNGNLGFYKPYGQDAVVFDWGDFRRNEIMSKLLEEKCISCNSVFGELEGHYFFWGWDVDFKYGDYNFRWHHNNHVYVMEDGYYSKRKEPKTDEDDPEISIYYCFDAKNITTAEEFVDKLKELIKQHSN